MLPVMVSSVDVEGLDIFEISNGRRKDHPRIESIMGSPVSGVGLLEENIEVLISRQIEDLNKRFWRQWTQSLRRQRINC